MKVVSFKRRKEDGPLRLRLCRMRDLRTLYPLFTPMIFPEGKGVKRKPNSLFTFYRWIKNTFQVIYLIEIEEKDGGRIIGFAGIYDIELGQKLRLSLALFKPEDRGRGYGEKALILLLRLLEEIRAAEAVYVEILKSNVPSLYLCGKLGFKVKKLYQDRFLLEKDQPFDPRGGEETCV